MGPWVSGSFLLQLHVMASYIAEGVILMPCYVNIGAYIDTGTMIDTWATVGSCAQVGKNVHLSGGVGIGGVLEPLQASPVIIEDGCFLGSRCVVVEGVRVEQRGCSRCKCRSDGINPDHRCLRVKTRRI